MSKDQTEATKPAAPAIEIKSRKAVQLPHFKTVVGKPMYIRIEEPLYMGKKMQEDRDPACLAKVTDLETGEMGTIIVSAVVKSVLTEEYEGESYVGKSFEITKLNKDGRGDKAYYPYSVFEIEVA